MNTPQIIDGVDRLHMEVDRQMRVKEAHIQARQEIPDEFLRQLRGERDHQDAKFAPDNVKIASIPVAVVNHWLRQGFNIWDRNVTPQDVINRLIREDLTAFLTTSKTYA